MISYNKALEIASKLKKNIEYCIEYDDAYRFCNHSNEISYGGAGRTSVVVLKKSGEAIPMNVYVLKGGTGNTVREFEIENEN